MSLDGIRNLGGPKSHDKCLSAKCNPAILAKLDERRKVLTRSNGEPGFIAIMDWYYTARDRATRNRLRSSPGSAKMRYSRRNHIFLYHSILYSPPSLTRLRSVMFVV